MPIIRRIPPESGYDIIDTDPVLPPVFQKSYEMAILVDFDMFRMHANSFDHWLIDILWVRGPISISTLYLKKCSSCWTIWSLGFVCYNLILPVKIDRNHRKFVFSKKANRLTMYRAQPIKPGCLRVFVMYAIICNYLKIYAKLKDS